MDSSSARVRFLLVVLACLTLVAAPAVSDIWAQAVGPHPIVGTWEGTWKIISHPNYGGDYSVTITKVEGNKANGRVEKLGGQGGRVAYDFVGTLEGDRLTYGNSLSSTELILSGNQLRGTSVDNLRLAIEMTRVK